MRTYKATVKIEKDMSPMQYIGHLVERMEMYDRLTKSEREEKEKYIKSKDKKIKRYQDKKTEIEAEINKVAVENGIHMCLPDRKAIG